MTSIEQRQLFPWNTLLAISCVVVACVYIASLTSAVDLSPYFGRVPPIVGAILTCAVGLGTLYSLHQFSGFSVYAPRTSKRGLVAAAALAIPFMIAVTVADVVFRFPVDINVALPTAIIFYPAMGFVAQIVLHVVPFALLLALGHVLFPASRLSWRIWVSIILASLPEVVLQVVSSLRGDEPILIATFVAGHLLFFGVVELYLYRRFDYATMYAFRIIYYAYWHLAWGNLRIYWLF